LPILFLIKLYSKKNNKLALEKEYKKATKADKKQGNVYVLLTAICGLPIMRSMKSEDLCYKRQEAIL